MVWQDIGPICCKHRRWHAGGSDIDMSNFPQHLKAQRRLNGWLRMHHASHRSPQARVAREIIHGWLDAALTRPLELYLHEEIADFPVLVSLLKELSSAPMMAAVNDKALSDRAVGDLVKSLVSYQGDVNIPTPKQGQSRRIRESLSGPVNSHRDPLWHVRGHIRRAHDEFERMKRDGDSYRTVLTQRAEAGESDENHSVEQWRAVEGLRSINDELEIANRDIHRWGLR